MRNLLFSLLAITGFAISATGQNGKTTSVQKTEKVKKEVKTDPHKKTVEKQVVLKKDGTPDKRYKEKRVVKKDGTTDKRYKENK